MVEIETTARQWLPYLLRGKPHQVIFNNNDPTPYLLRWYIIPRNRHLNVYLHKFLRSDDDRALHDHPWPFWSFILNRPYLEYTMQGPNPHVRKRFSLAYRPTNWRHRVDLQWCIVHPDGMHKAGKYVQPPVWTIVVTGPKCRTWGFWCHDPVPPEDEALAAWPGPNTTERFVRWQDWVESRGCGEP